DTVSFPGGKNTTFPVSSQVTFSSLPTIMSCAEPIEGRAQTMSIGRSPNTKRLRKALSVSDMASSLIRASFDYLIRPQQQRRRDRQPQCLGGLEVDHEVELCRLLDGEVSRLRTFQDSIHVVRSAPIYGGKVCPVGEESSGLSKVLVQRDNGQQVLRRQIEDLNSVLRERYILEDDESFGATSGCSLKCAQEIALSAHGKA